MSLPLVVKYTTKERKKKKKKVDPYEFSRVIQFLTFPQCHDRAGQYGTSIRMSKSLPLQTERK